MPDPARIMDLAAGVAAFLQTSWNPTAPDLVHAVWVERFSLNPNDPDRLLSGRRVAVIPALPELAALTRGEWRNRYTLAVVYAERFAGSGIPDDAWIGERVRWWEQTVLYPLGNPALVVEGPAGKCPAAVPDPETPPEVTEFLDRDKLTDLKLLYVVANFAFVDVCDHTGAG